MSSVPTWKRNIDETLKVQVFASKIRLEIDSLMIRKFWLKDRNNAIRKRHRPNQDEPITFDEFKWWFRNEQ